MVSAAGFSTVDDYLKAAAPEAQSALIKIRKLARKRCPEAEETIAYQMPALRQGRVFFYYAAFKMHIGIYPPVTADASLVADLEPYRNEKGNLKFLLEKPMPYTLIERVIVALAQQYATHK